MTLSDYEKKHKGKRYADVNESAEQFLGSNLGKTGRDTRTNFEIE